MDSLVERLEAEARRSAEVLSMLQDAKTERNRAAGDSESKYGHVKPEHTLAWEAAQRIKELEAEREQTRNAIDSCLSAALDWQEYSNAAEARAERAEKALAEAELHAAEDDALIRNLELRLKANGIDPTTGSPLTALDEG